jgi:amino acid adenylation domain-containing protein
VTIPKDLKSLFERSAAEYAQRTAVTCDGVSLSYDELNRRANKLAHELIARGVRTDHLVAIAMERNTDLVIGLLAILKAGGAYLPIDLAYPAERIRFMLEDGEPVVILTQTHLADRFADMERDKLLLVDTTALDGTGDESDPVVTIDPDQLAYVMYTSGSTGQPKGVMITHHNVGRLLTATQPWYQFGQDDVWSFFHSYAFDVSVYEMWGAFAYGGRLVVVPYLVSRTPDDFLRLLASEGVTVLSQTPSAFRQVMNALEQAPDLAARLRIRYVIFAGEKLEFHSLAPWFARPELRAARLINMYGITETTVHVTFFEVLESHLGQTRSLIGIPMPDLQLHLLDDERKPVPVGEVGELYVGGPGLARGYFKRPELTAERFIPDHVSGQPGARLYKSGDLAKLLPDGGFEYIGRADMQVKIRGFRIELGEIEAVLAGHPDIRESAMKAIDDSSGEKRLVAYYSCAPGRTLTPEALREFLSPKLPDYFLPHFYVPLQTLPLTNNGKIDRRALPAPGKDRPNLAQALVHPATPLQKTVAAIWESVLEVSPVGIDDNFFDLGGTSLKLMTVLEQIKKGVDPSVSAPDLFENPTVRLTAARIEKGRTSEITILDGRMRAVRQSEVLKRMRQARAE